MYLPQGWAPDILALQEHFISYQIILPAFHINTSGSTQTFSAGLAKKVTAEIVFRNKEFFLRTVSAKKITAEIVFEIKSFY